MREAEGVGPFVLCHADHRTQRQRVAVVGFQRKQIPEVWLNPGADEDQVVARARQLGLNVIQACSIVGIGDSPYRY